MARVIVDLSVPLTNNMPAHKFFPRPVMLPHFTHDEMETGATARLRIHSADARRFWR